MTTPAQPVNGTFEPKPAAVAALTPTRPFYWSVRRELFEYRSIYLAPLAIGGVVLLGFVFVLVRLPQTLQRSLAMEPIAHRHALAQPFDVAASLIMMAAFIVSIFYSLDCLYGERRDRSILFWKSLPVSDLTTVLSKACILLLVLQVLSFAITLVVETIMLLLSSAVVAGSGFSVVEYWNSLELYRTLWGLAYHLITIHMLWYAPLYCWLLLVSAWSRRMPFLWAVLPPFGVVIFEKIAFHTSYFQNFLIERVSGGTEAVGGGKGNMLDPDMHMTPGPFLLTPGLWLGLLFAAAFLWSAARLRRQRSPL